MSSSLLTSARIRWFTPPALLIALAGPAVSTTRADDNLHEQLSVAEKFTGDLPEMRKRKRIRALVTYSKKDFFFHQGGAVGVQTERYDFDHLALSAQAYQESGLDPDIWFSNVELAAGKMTGRETVQYVANIYKYYVAYKLASQVTNTDAVPISSAR